MSNTGHNALYVTLSEKRGHEKVCRFCQSTACGNLACAVSPGSIYDWALLFHFKLCVAAAGSIACSIAPSQNHCSQEYHGHQRRHHMVRLACEALSSVLSTNRGSLLPMSSDTPQILGILALTSARNCCSTAEASGQLNVIMSPD